MATKELKTRIRLRYDHYQTWTDNNTKLLEGEIAIAYLGPVLEENKAPTPNNGTYPVMFKVGPGNFNSLPWASALAADVYSWAKKEYGESSDIIYKAAVKDEEGNVIENAITVKNALDTLNNAIDVFESFIKTLNYADAEETNKYVVAVIQENGKIRTIKKELTLPDYEDTDTTYTLTYDEEKREIVLTPSNGGTPSTIDATAFIKDGFLKKVEYDKENNELLFTWNTVARDNNEIIEESSTTIGLSDLVDVYTGVDTDTIDMTVENYTIKAEVKDQSITLEKLSDEVIDDIPFHNTGDGLKVSTVIDEDTQREVKTLDFDDECVFVFCCGNASENIDDLN